jgi:hypothetical protein
VRKQGSRSPQPDTNQGKTGSPPNTSGPLVAEAQAKSEQRLKDHDPDRCLEMEQALALRVQLAECHLSHAESGLASVEAGLRAADACFATLRVLAQMAGFQLSDKPNGDLGERRHLSRPQLAALMNVCIRLIDRQKTRMTERVHYHYNGRRILFHNPEAVDFILASRTKEPPEEDLEQLATAEIARRKNRRERAKPSGGESSEGGEK